MEFQKGHFPFCSFVETRDWTFSGPPTPMWACGRVTTNLAEGGSRQKRNTRTLFLSLSLSFDIGWWLETEGLPCRLT